VSDLFGNNGLGSQMSLFGNVPDRLAHAPEADFTPDQGQIRQRLTAILETARAAPARPWPEKKQRVWQTMFPNMAKWLPEDEAKQLCFEFACEIERLMLAA